MHRSPPTLPTRPAHRRGGLRRGRVGTTLIEIAVVIAIILMIGAVALPALNGFLLMEQSAAAKNLGITFKYLRDEAALRNVTFRVAFDLDKRTYEVQVGDPRTLIFLTPDERVAYEDALEDKLASTTEREREEGAGEDGDDAGLLSFQGISALFTGGGGDNAENAEGEDAVSPPPPPTDDGPVESGSGGDVAARAAGLADPALLGPVALPEGTIFAWVWTPQYAEPVAPSRDLEEDPLEEGELGTMAYTYIFPNGTVEYTLIRIVSEDDPEEGYTIEVEPVSGRLNIMEEERRPEDATSWLPDEGPELEQP